MAQGRRRSASCSTNDDPGPDGRRLSASALRVALAANLAIVVLAAVVAVVLLVLALRRGS